MSSSFPSNSFVTDTIALVLHLEKRRMGSQAKSAFEQAEAGTATIHIPAMVLAEVLYLSERGRIKLSLQAVQSYLKKHTKIQVYPLDLSVVSAAATLSDIPELHDRLIAATAVVTGVPLLTNDLVIAAAKNVSTLW